MALGMDRMLMEQALRDRLATILREFGEDEGWAVIERCIQATVHQQYMAQAHNLALRGLGEYE